MIHAKIIKELEINSLEIIIQPKQKNIGLRGHINIALFEKQLESYIFLSDQDDFGGIPKNWGSSEFLQFGISICSYSAMHVDLG